MTRHGWCLWKGMSSWTGDLTYGLGLATGLAIGPFFGLVSALRRARTFHPVGDVFLGEVRVDPAARKGDQILAQRLEGDVLVRLSDALSKEGPGKYDVLGCALRFGRGLRAIEGDQDLLFATIRRPWTMPFAPFFTKVDDYLANDYFAVSPFETWEHERAYFRIHPELFDGATYEVFSPNRASRRERVIRKAGAGDLVFELEIANGPWGPFRPLARISITDVLPIDPPDLAFDPFSNGAGIMPSGFVHAMRRGAYAASRFTRKLIRGNEEDAVIPSPPRALHLSEPNHYSQVEELKKAS